MRLAVKRSSSVLPICNICTWANTEEELKKAIFEATTWIKLVELSFNATPYVDESQEVSQIETAKMYIYFSLLFKNEKELNEFMKLIIKGGWKIF